MDVVRIGEALAVGVVPWRTADGSLTVVVKATLRLDADGEAELAEEQEPLSLDRPAPGGSESDLAYGSDFVPLKARVDVLLAGHARRPAPATVLPIRFAVDAMERALLALASPPSARVPLLPRYLRASASLTAAPVRVGPVRADVPAGDDVAPPAWTAERFDFSRFNVAPAEQRLGLLRSGTRIVLEGLLADAPRRQVTLPPLRPRILYAPDGPATETPREVALRCDTLWIDTDRANCVLVWRGVLVPPERRGSAPLLVLVTRRDAREPAPWRTLRGAVEQAPRVQAADAESAGRAPPAPRGLLMELGRSALGVRLEPMRDPRSRSLEPKRAPDEPTPIDDEPTPPATRDAAGGPGDEALLDEPTASGDEREGGDDDLSFSDAPTGTRDPRERHLADEPTEEPTTSRFAEAQRPGGALQLGRSALGARPLGTSAPAPPAVEPQTGEDDAGARRRRDPLSGTVRISREGLAKILESREVPGRADAGRSAPDRLTGTVRMSASDVEPWRGQPTSPIEPAPRPRAPLPTVKLPIASESAPAEPARGEPARDARPERPRDALTETLAVSPGHVADPALPFEDPEPPTPRPAPRRPPAPTVNLTSTVTSSARAPLPTLPFRSPGAAPPTPPRSSDDGEHTGQISIAAIRRAALPFGREAAPPAAEEATGVIDLSRLQRAPLPFDGRAAHDAPATAAPAPPGAPARLGGLAGTWAPAAPMSDAGAPSSPAAAAIARGAEDAPDQAPKASELLPLERYASIRVELWARRASLAEVLERHGLDELAWRAHEGRWLAELGREAAEGRVERALALRAAIARAGAAMPRPQPGAA